MSQCVCVCVFFWGGGGGNNTVENSFGRRTETSGENGGEVFRPEVQLSHTAALSVGAAGAGGRPRVIPHRRRKV